jgi:hypothetical protein
MVASHSAVSFEAASESDEMQACSSCMREADMIRVVQQRVDDARTIKTSCAECDETKFETHMLTRLLQCNGAKLADSTDGDCKLK